jgi:hypothetical protein
VVIDSFKTTKKFNLTTFRVTENVKGEYPDKSIKEVAENFLWLILTSPIRLLTIFNKGYNTPKNSLWEHMLTDEKLKIEKRLSATTGVDDSIRFFALSTSDANLNALIRDKYFGDFIIMLDSGILLRHFNNPRSWPNSSLVYIAFDTYKIETIVKSKSAWTNWKYSMIDNNHIEIVTEQSQDYTKVISVIR